MKKPVLTCRSTALVFFMLLRAMKCAQAVRGDEVLRLSITQSGSNAVITWTNVGVVLESALSVTGIWNQVTGAASPYSVGVTNAANFFRLRQVPSSDFAFRYLAPSFS